MAIQSIGLKVVAFKTAAGIVLFLLVPDAQ